MPKINKTEAEQRRKNIRDDIKDMMNRNEMDNAKLSNLLGISIATLCTKKKNPERFTLGEIWIMERAFGCIVSKPLQKG